jgi:hypothetical protein
MRRMGPALWTRGPEVRNLVGRGLGREKGYKHVYAPNQPLSIRNPALNCNWYRLFHLYTSSCSAGSALSELGSNQQREDLG